MNHRHTPECTPANCDVSGTEWNAMRVHEALITRPERPRTVYVCGPRTGLPEENIPAILAAADALRTLGYSVLEPVSINLIFLGTTYSPNIGLVQTFPGLRADIIALLSCCDGIALMPGWEDARGCRLEVALAITLRYRFVHRQTGEIIAHPAVVAIDHGYGEANPYFAEAFYLINQRYSPDTHTQTAPEWNPDQLPLSTNR